MHIWYALVWSVDTVSLPTACSSAADSDYFCNVQLRLLAQKQAKPWTKFLTLHSCLTGEKCLKDTKLVLSQGLIASQLTNNTIASTMKCSMSPFPG